MSTSPLPLPEIQGLLASGYQKQSFACYILLRIVDAAAAREWLAGLNQHITYCDQDGRDSLSKLNVAVSFHGLVQFGCAADELVGFSREFSEGMVTPHRQRILGDLTGSASDPDRWRWGGHRQAAVDVMVMLFETKPLLLQQARTTLREQLRGVEIVSELPVTPLKENREHFGFRDGMGQPVVRGFGRSGPARDEIAAGEFILGHADQRGAFEPAPTLARNGSYLVVRQVVQDVPAFWRTFADRSAAEKIALAAKMVGRWPDGTPLTLSPQSPDRSNPTNDFAFKAGDDAGLRCPFGAHIRRANPRDDLFDDAAQSQAMANRHRLLRRGRSFGLPVAPEIYPPGLAVEAEPDAPGSTDSRGIYFVCLNASLSRQFEFVQQTWLNNAKFGGLSDETDPVAGGIRWAAPDQSPHFSIPADPVRCRLALQETFVHTVGGEYFFLPGRTALHHLASR